APTIETATKPRKDENKVKFRFVLSCFRGRSSQHAADRLERRINPDDVARAAQRLRERFRLPDRPADDRFDDLRELRGMRRREKDPRLALVSYPRDLAFEPQVCDRRVRIEQIAALFVHAPD